MAAATGGASLDTSGPHPLLKLKPEHLMGSIRRGMEANLLVFLVDASGSMAAKDRLGAVTGAVMSVLGDAYQRRDKVAVISVRGAEPELLLPPTTSIDVARKRLANAQVGGRTPLAAGLSLAEKVIVREARKDPSRRALLLVLSDGRDTSGAGTAGVHRAARHLSSKQVPVGGDGTGSSTIASVVIDCEKAGRIRLGLAADLARNLGAPCLRLEDLSAEAVAGIVGVG